VQNSKVTQFLNSYRNRYLLIGIVLSLALGLVAWVGYIQVEKASDSNFQRITQRNRVSTILTKIGEGRNTLLALLQNIVIEPDREKIERIPLVLDKLFSGISDLQNETSVHTSEKYLIVNELKRDLDELRARSDKLVETRLDEMLWFPATDELQNKLLPEFLNSLTLLQELAQTLSDGESIEDHDAYNIVQEVRMIWVRMTAELRLLVANRFGVFSIDTQKGMEGRYENLTQYSLRLQSSLYELGTFAEQGRLGAFGQEWVVNL